MEYAATPPVAVPGIQGFLQRVFAWMVAGLLVTAAAAAAIGASDELLTTLTENPLILLGIFVLQLAFVFVIAGAAERLPAAVAVALFFVYAGLNGVIFALVFELYTAQSIFTTFLVTAVMFGALAAYGYVTRRDLSKLGAILFMALVGLIAATIVNIFVASTALYWITTYAGVAIFAGLTAYDMQKLRQIGEAGGGGTGVAISGALALYLDFINLFLFLLRIFGQSR